MYGWGIKGSKVGSHEDDFIVGDFGITAKKKAKAELSAAFKKESKMYPLWGYIFKTDSPLESNFTLEEAKAVSTVFEEKQLCKGEPEKAAAAMKEFSDYCRSESQIQSAMVHGIQGYNDWDH